MRKAKIRIFLVLLMSALAVSGFAQKDGIDTIAYRFIYDVQLKSLKSSKQLGNDEHYLEIGENGISKYYSAWKDKRRKIMDSIYSSGGEQYDILRVLQEQGINASNFHYYVYKNYPLEGVHTVNYSSLEDLQYEEPMGQNWTLQDGDTIILDYRCGKAESFYHGRKWTAWFAFDIPISDGPWKLSGLPGLILKAEDERHEFIFRCMGISNGVNQPMVMNKGHFSKMKPEKAHQTIEMMLNNQPLYEKMKYGSNSSTYVTDKGGKTVKLDPPQWVLIETYTSK